MYSTRDARHLFPLCLLTFAGVACTSSTPATGGGDGGMVGTTTGAGGSTTTGAGGANGTGGRGGAGGAVGTGGTVGSGAGGAVDCTGASTTPPAASPLVGWAAMNTMNTTATTGGGDIAPVTVTTT